MQALIGNWQLILDFGVAIVGTSLVNTLILATTDTSSMKNMHTLLDPTGFDLPLDLLQKYDCGNIDPAMRGMMLSSKGVLLVLEDDVARLRVCSECNDYIRKLALPKFAIRNCIFIGELDKGLVALPLENAW